LFIVGGAFVGLDKIVNKKLKKGSIGFNQKVHSKKTDVNWLDHVEHDDIISYGLIPEFAGRLPNIVGLEDLGEEDMFNILTNAKSSCITQVQRLLELDEIELQFGDQYLKDVAQIAVKKKVGARGLKSIVENSLHNIMFRAPVLRQENVEQVIFNEYPKMVDMHPVFVYTNGNSEKDRHYKIKLRGKSEL
jgi:ATP-dependent Clp protease ATP-binding subunit ClpX